ncbi:hypothetical protein CALVIDRAFT_379193 [Calocera viscosa TUFC12733]|uniref:Uncharacterized protein n=1 Tax=Calocera viscosa (strain TUFC12733) TaxID=1330018 RepID=A0A167Q3M6_CALVF|nr:hypothetical protein CALVIDRAFT_379193 [Calocera viscosa TUFC12733]
MTHLLDSSSAYLCLVTVLGISGQQLISIKARPRAEQSYHGGLQRSCVLFCPDERDAADLPLFHLGGLTGAPTVVGASGSYLSGHTIHRPGHSRATHFQASIIMRPFSTT